MGKRFGFLMYCLCVCDVSQLQQSFYFSFHILQPSTEADHRTGMVCTSGGRRHILGLAQAIREKAFQSTTPLSEKNHNLSARHGKREHVSDPQLQVIAHVLTYLTAST